MAARNRHLRAAVAGRSHAAGATDVRIRWTSGRGPDPPGFPEFDGISLPQKQCAGPSQGRRIVDRTDAAGYLTLTSLISNCTATFGGNGVRGSAP